MREFKGLQCKKIHWIKRLFLLFLFSFPALLFASPPSSPYAPGETLNPTCAPTDANCTVEQIYVSTTTLNYSIGSSSPFARFSIAGTSTASTALFAISTSSASATSTALIVTGRGKIGIGTTTPYAELSVSGLTASSYFNADNISATSTFAGGALFGLGGGFVGIGTTTPSAKLTVSGGSILQVATGTPTLRANYSSNSAYSVAVQGKYAYIANRTSTFDIVDITRPASSTRVSALSVGSPVDVVVNGNYAYVSDETNRQLKIIDVSNPTAPFVVGSITFATGGVNVFVAGRYAYVAADTAGLYIVDISTPSSPTLVGTYNTPGNAYDVYVVGRYAYVSDTWFGLQIIDVGNHFQPTLVGQYQTAGRSLAVYVAGGYAYVGDEFGGTNGFKVVDVHNPAVPVTLGSYMSSDGSYQVFDMVALGKYLYTASSVYGLQIFDISNPNVPSLAGTYNTPGIANKVFVDGKYAYVADETSGIEIFDLMGLDTPTILTGSIETSTLHVGEFLNVSGGISVGDYANFGVGGLFSSGPGSFSPFATTSLASTSALTASVTDANAGTGDIISLFHMASATASNGIGAGILFGNEDISGNGTSTSRILSILSNVSSSSPTSVLTFSNKNTTGRLTEFMRLDQNGLLGISTTSPYAKLSVVGQVVAASYVGTTTATSTFAGGATFAVSGGNVGIGTSTPAATLNVIGSVCVDDRTPTCSDAARADGTIYSVAALSASLDLAESYPTKDETLEAGEIVMTDSENNIFVKRADVNSLGTTLGIVSTAPGFYLGGFNSSVFPNENKIPVALSGRVPLKVNMEGGVIRPGDWITRSSVPGIGKKAGTSGEMVAVALESYDGTAPENKISAFVKVGYHQIQNENQAGALSLESIKNSIAAISEWTVNQLTAVAGLFKHIETDTLRVNKGIELKDTESGEAYCVTIKGGEWNKVKGNCDAPAAGAGTSSSSPLSTSTLQLSTDILAPVITLLGSNPTKLDFGTPYIDLGATVSDNTDKNLGLHTSHEVIDTKIPGTYSVIYTAVDQAGNRATSTREVVVKPKPIPLSSVSSTTPSLSSTSTPLVPLSVGTSTATTTVHTP